ncbi:MAG: membrane protein insertase YidC [Planctomycetes bacterium]|nr:membrane protein insertase YidC [Planctomycetota bacterium]NOG52904.1 membrane protein insertase YidC [Planctomycetota bacterium]
MPRQKSSILRIVIPAGVIVIGGLIALSQLNFGSSKQGPTDASRTASSQTTDDSPDTGLEPTTGRPTAGQDQQPQSPPAGAEDGKASGDDSASQPDDAAESQQSTPEQSPGPLTDGSLTGLHLRTGPPVAFDPLGDIHAVSAGSAPPDPLRIDFAPGAGIAQVTLRDYFTTRQQTFNYQLFENPTTGRPVMGIQWLVIEDQWVKCQPLNPQSSEQTESYWTQLAPGSFQAVVVNDDDEPVATVRLTYTIAPPDGRIDVFYSIENHTDAALSVRVEQWGPADLPYVPGGYGDYRRFRFGYLDPRSSRDVLASESSYLEARSKVLSRAIKNDRELAAEGRYSDPTNQQLWPNETSGEKGHTLAWVATTNRYFTFAVYPHLDDAANATDRSLDRVARVSWWFEPHSYQGVDGLPYWEERLAQINDREDALRDRFISTRLSSPLTRIEPGQTHTTELECYAGPLKRSVLSSEQPYKYFNLKDLVIYQLGCAWCTFQWLTHVLLAFLRLIYGEVIAIGSFGLGVHDWAISIIILVLCVRTLLHPLTKRGQVSMQRFSKKMGTLQPEMKKLQAKYKDNPKKLQAEQMRLYKEHNVNPAGCLGMAPMFLQMPIWVALYATLYFAIELRQQPAFYGIFQLFGNWSFLADMSKPDNFIDFGAPVVTLIPFLKSYPNLADWPIVGSFSSINVLPILMGGIFYFQQKYLTPPQANMSPEQETQQKIMKIMMILMFPIMLYRAPSGLTLYIITSSTIGIAESRYIRAHVAAMDEEKKTAGNGSKKPSKKKKKKAESGVQGFFQRAIEEGQKRQREKDRQKQKQNKRRKY